MLLAIKIPSTLRKLTRSQRLQQAEDFRAVLQNKTTFNGNFLRLHIKLNHFGFARLGLIVAKRIERKAVRRNRIKRAVREAFRLHQQVLVGLDCVMQLRNPVDLSNDYLRLRAETLTLLKRADGYLKKYAATTDQPH